MQYKIDQERKKNNTPTFYLESGTERLDESVDVDSEEEDEDLQSGTMSLCHRSFQLNSPAEVSNFLKILGVSISFDLAANLNSTQMENKDNKSEEDIPDDSADGPSEDWLKKSLER